MTDQKLLTGTFAPHPEAAPWHRRKTGQPSLAVLNPDRCEEPQRDRISGERRRRLNHAAEQIPELVVARPHRRERFKRDVHERHRRWLVRLRERVHLRDRLGLLDLRLQVAGRVREGAPSQEYFVGVGSHDAADARNLAVVARRRLGHQGALGEIDPHPAVRGAGVEGQAHGAGKDAILPVWQG